jgi:hypothetical protein
LLSTLPDLLIGLVFVLVLSASMSTLSSLVLTSSSTLTIDLIKGRLIKDMDEKKQLLCMRTLLVVFVALSAGIALWQYTLSGQLHRPAHGHLLGALAGLPRAVPLGPVQQPHLARCRVGELHIGVGLTTANMFIGFIASPVNAGAIAMLLSLAVVPHVSLFTPAVPSSLTRPQSLVRCSPTQKNSWGRVGARPTWDSLWTSTNPSLSIIIVQKRSNGGCHVHRYRREALLQQPCWVIDCLPTQVPAGSDGTVLCGGTSLLTERTHVEQSSVVRLPPSCSSSTATRLLGVSRATRESQAQPQA